MQRWAVIAFDDEDTVATIPSTWLFKASGKDMCYWPSKSKNASGYVRRREEPGDDWERYAVTILGKYASYEIAVKKALKAEETSELSSTNETATRKRTQNRKYLMTSTDAEENNKSSGDSEREESDDDYPKLPKIQKFDFHFDARSTTKRNINNSVFQKSKVTPKSQDEDIIEITPVSKRCNDEHSTLDSTITRFINPPNTSVSEENTPLSSKRIGTFNANLPEDKEFKRQVLTKLNIIIAKLNGHDEKFEALDNLFQNLASKSDEDDTPFTGLELLPVNNDDSLAVCEQFLSDRSNLKKLAKELSRMGGTTAQEITRKLLYRVISNEFAELYSWEGGKGKRKFINVTLSRLVIDAVRCNKRTQNCCEDEIIQEIKRWLAKAKERVKNESKKKERQVHNGEQQGQQLMADTLEDTNN